MSEKGRDTERDGEKEREIEGGRGGREILVFCQ